MKKISPGERLPLDWYKENVNLVEFAHAMYGFEINQKRMPKFSSSLPHWIIMDNTEGEHFIFSRNLQKRANNAETSHYYYINTTGNSKEPVFGNNREDQGSIFDFIMFREGCDLGKAICKIKHFVNEIAPNLKEVDVYTLKASEKMPLGEVMPHFGIKPINYTNPDGLITKFFEMRSIPKDVLTEAKFSNQMYYRPFQNPFGYNIADLCFPITSPKEKNFVGFFAINQFSADQPSFKQILGYKGDGLWFSAFDKTKPVDSLIITESPVDAISHYYMNPTLKEKNIIYASTIGSVSSHQIKTIDMVIDTYTPKNVCLSCDRDSAGQIFNLSIAAKSNQISNEFEHFQLFFASNSHHVGEFTLNFKCKSKEDTKEKTVQLKEFLDRASNILAPYYTERKAFNTIIKNISETEASLNVDFIATPGNWNALTKMVLDYKFDPSIHWDINLPVNKDFNQDLQMAKIAHQAEKEELISGGIKQIPSFDDFVTENYNMTGEKCDLFIDNRPESIDKSPFVQSQDHTRNQSNSQKM